MSSRRTIAPAFRIRIRHWAPAFALGLCASCGVQAEPTTLSVGNGIEGTSDLPRTMGFPISRSGDTSYDVQLSFRTVDGTAQAGIDYTATSGTTIFPAGATSIVVPVVIAPNTSNQSLTFGLTLNTPLLPVANTPILPVGIGLPPSFSSSQTFVAGSSPYSVASADLNGDGQADLIAANYSDNTVSVLLNTTAPGVATPVFATQQIFATGSNPFVVRIADVNSDGKPDLIVLNAGDATISVLINTTLPGSSTPTFATRQSFATGNIPLAVTAADIDGDGNPDLIVVNAGDNTVSVLRNTTPPGSLTPTFSSRVNFATGANPHAVAVADVNHDGRPDLIVANADDNSISVLLNNASAGMPANFATRQTLATGHFPTSVAATDINSDGNIDLIVANRTDNTLTVLLNTTAPGATTASFGTAQGFAAGVRPDSVFAADLNGDGRPDLVAANRSDNTVSVLRNSTAPGAAQPTFAAQQTFVVGTNPVSVVSADLNGDGLADLVVANLADATLSILRNTSSVGITAVNFAPSEYFNSGTSLPNSLVAVDLNGDGKPDLLSESQSFGNISILFDTTLPNATTPTFAALQSFGSNVSEFYAACADLNGDGKPDLIVAGSSGLDALFNATVPGAFQFDMSAQQFLPVYAASLALADVNGDGKADIVSGNTDGSVSVMLNNALPGAALPNFAAGQTVATPANSPQSVAVADINGDGKPDLILANINIYAGPGTPSDNSVFVLLNTTDAGATTMSFSAPQSFPVGNFPEAVRTADINGDGKPDLIVVNGLNESTNTSDNLVTVLLNTTGPGATTATFSAAQSFPTGNYPIAVAVADLDGDGKLDLVVANGYNENNGTSDNSVSVLINATAPGATVPSFAPQQVFPIGSGLSPDAVTTTDINGDGKPDIVIANRNATIAVLLNTQYLSLTGTPTAMATIVPDHDYIFADGFE